MFASLIAQTDFTDRVRSFWNHVVDFAETEGTTWMMNIVAALAIFFIGRWVIMFIRRIIRKAFARARVDETLSKFLANIAYAILLTLVIVAAVSQLGVDTTSFAAVLAAAGLAVGLALQGSLSNFASGVMIILFQPFRVGDFIEAGGATGVVEEIHIFSTWMRTFDNKQIVVPNNAITSSVITNYSAKPTRRIDLIVGCGYDDNLREVKEFLEQLIRSDDRILEDPEPVIAVDQLGDSSVNLVVRPWVNREDYASVRWGLIEKIKLGFDDLGFSIPFPQRDVHVYQQGEGAEAKSA